MTNDLHHDDHEGSMARAELYRAAKYAMKLFEMIDENQELEGWVQSKITKSADYLDSVYHYMEYQVKFGGGDNATDLEDITMDAKEKISNDVDEMDVVDDEEMEMKVDESMSYEEKLLAILENRVDEKKKSKETTEGKKNCGCGQDPCITYGKQEEVTEGDNIYHSCVKSFKHDKFGEGTVLHGEHTLAEDGTVTHYDATFVREDGTPILVKNIPVANMKDCVVVEHGHPKKKKKVKEEEVVVKETQAQRFIRAMEEKGYTKEQLLSALTNEGVWDAIKSGAGKVGDAIFGSEEEHKAKREAEQTIVRHLQQATDAEEIGGLIHSYCDGDYLECLYSYMKERGIPSTPEIDSIADKFKLRGNANMQMDIDPMDKSWRDMKESKALTKSVVKRVLAEKKKQIDQNDDGKHDWEDVKIARMKAAAKAKDKKKDTKESVEFDRMKEFLARLIKV